MSSLKVACAVGASLIGAGMACAQTPSVHPDPQVLVSALKGVFGQHAGARASHAKGQCVVGIFTPHPEASKVVGAAFLKEKRLPLTGRFSVGGGNPQASDKGKTVRGMALRFGAVDQPILDLVLLSAPVFMVATPEEFVDFMKARQLDPATGKPDPARVSAFNAAHPSTQAQLSYLAATDAPASYATTPYWGVNAFRFQNGNKPWFHGRWRADPVAGVQGLKADDLTKLEDHFLVKELDTRLGAAPVEFDLKLQLAAPGDDVLNPTKVWPPERTEVTMGRIRIDRMEAGCDNLMFNPAQLPKGIALSNDPTLLVRAGAYSVSLAQRLSK